MMWTVQLVQRHHFVSSSHPRSHLPKFLPHSPPCKRSAVQTPRNTNTAQSFLWGRGSSKSVPDSPADPAHLSRWDTPLIKATDCTLCWGELPQTDAHCESRLCGCVRYWVGVDRRWTRKGRNPRHESTCVAPIIYSRRGGMVSWPYGFLELFLCPSSQLTLSFASWKKETLVDWFKNKM